MILKEIISFAAVTIGSRKETLCAPTAVQISDLLEISRWQIKEEVPLGTSEAAAELTWQPFRLNWQMCELEGRLGGAKLWVMR